MAECEGFVEREKIKMGDMSITRGFGKTRCAKMEGFKNQVKSSDNWGSNPLSQTWPCLSFCL